MDSQYRTMLVRAISVLGGVALGIAIRSYLESSSKKGDESLRKALQDVEKLKSELQATKSSLKTAETKLINFITESSSDSPLATSSFHHSNAAASPTTSSSSQNSSSLSTTTTTNGTTSRKPVRVYMDGCFDMMHYGHSNALRQAKGCGDILVVGLVNDEEIVKYKGSHPVMNEEERYQALAACKWADEIVRNAPYEVTEEWVNLLVKEHKVDFIVHGDDPCITPDGKDAYAYAKEIGVYKQVKRTEGVSTTDIVGRMLLMTKDHHVPDDSLVHSTTNNNATASSTTGNSSTTDATSAAAAAASKSNNRRSSSFAGEEGASSTRSDSSSTTAESSSSSSSNRMTKILAQLPSAHSKFLPTARRIMQFADGKVPKPTDKVVYVCGSWDLFNSGHIGALQEARKLGDFLLVGIHDDQTVNSLRENGLPILNLYERALSLLSCKYVDEVIIGAPWIISEDLITTMNISVVARGTVSDIANSAGHSKLSLDFSSPDVNSALEQEYAVPTRLGIVRTFKSPSPLTALNVIQRIMEQREQYQRRYEKKSKAETEYVAAKGYVQEG